MKRDNVCSFDSFYSSHPMGFGTQPSKFVVNWIEKNEFTRPPRKALDLGCGNGRNAFFLEQSGFAVVAIDISSQAIMNLRAAAKAAHARQNIAAVCADACSISLPQNEFDIALAYTLIDHIERPLADSLIAKILHSLKPGGHFLVTVYSDNDPSVRSLHNSTASPSSFWIKNPYSRDDLFSAFSNFNIMSHKEIDFEDNNHDYVHRHVMHQIIAQKPAH